MSDLLRTRSSREAKPGRAYGGADRTAVDDRTLVARARIDQEAFAELYRRYVEGIYWYCVGRLRDSGAAEDATSQVFAQAFAALPRYRDHDRESAFRAWLFRIAHNVVIDAMRAQRGHESLTVAVDLADDADLPEEVAIHGEAERALWAAVHTLPPEQRSVVELRLVGLTGSEIAMVLGRSRSAVDTAQSRAVSRLRTLLQSQGLPQCAESTNDQSR